MRLGLLVRLGLLIALLGVAACNTARGVGKDIEAGGRALGRAADAVERELSD
jgi:Predicted small secreted protein